MNSLPLASALIESAENLSMTVDLENPLPSALPSYPGIALADICLVRTDDDAAHAYAHLSMLKVIGFDTETKPVFQKGQRNDGPHLIQLASETKAFLFPVVQPMNVDVVKSLLEAPSILKVGYGLSPTAHREAETAKAHRG